MNEHHDRQLRLGALQRLPEIEIKTVLALRPNPGSRLVANMWLRTGPSDTQRRSHPAPVCCWLGRAPAQITNRRGGVGNAAEDGEVSSGCTLDVASVKMGYCGRRALAGRRVARSQRKERAQNDAAGIDAHAGGVPRT